MQATTSTTTTYAPSAEECRFCGAFHGVRCPQVKSIEYHKDGSVKRVEFVEPAYPYPRPTDPPTWWTFPTVNTFCSRCGAIVPDTGTHVCHTVSPLLPTVNSITLKK